ncbi:MAG: phosphatase PAP2 family protein [Spirochaetes bacterium]|nr:phosphatase PAP2 family protein [Spirochaetota bacterium]
MLGKIIKIDELILNKLSKYSKYNFLNIITSFGDIIFIVCFIAILFFFPVKNSRDIAIISMMSFLINTGIVFLLKYSVRRKRYINYNYLFYKFDPYSFPSGHVSRLSGFIFTTSTLPFLQILFLFLSIIVSIARMIKGYHYFSDCLVGFVIGLGSGFVAWTFSFVYIDFIIGIL